MLLYFAGGGACIGNPVRLDEANPPAGAPAPRIFAG